MILVPESVRPGDLELLAELAKSSELPTLRDCSRSAIQNYSQRASIERATALLYDRTVRDAANQHFLNLVRANDFAPARLPLVGIVPGAFYRDHANTGADGAVIQNDLQCLGCRVEIVPVDSFGSLSTNAAIIHQWLEQRRGQPIVLVSLSKGSADMKVALGMAGANERFKNVVAWISVSGLPQGTPLVAWLNRRPLRRIGVSFLLWWRKQRYSVVVELSDAPGAVLTSWPTLPPHLKIIHVVGFPLRRHLSHAWATRGYDRICPLGPNDGGGFLLADVAAMPGVVVPVWGADHYLQPAWDVAALLRRVFTAALTLQAEDRQAAQSASQPRIPPASKSNA